MGRTLTHFLNHSSGLVFCETTGQDPYPVREPFLWSGLLINMCVETAVVSNLHGTFIIMNLAQNVPLVLSKCVCVCVCV